MHIYLGVSNPILDFLLAKCWKFFIGQHIDIRLLPKSICRLIRFEMVKWPSKYLNRLLAVGYMEPIRKVLSYDFAAAINSIAGMTNLVHFYYGHTIFKGCRFSSVMRRMYS